MDGAKHGRFTILFSFALIFVAVCRVCLLRLHIPHQFLVPFSRGQLIRVGGSLISITIFGGNGGCVNLSLSWNQRPGSLRASIPFACKECFAGRGEGG